MIRLFLGLMMIAGVALGAAVALGVFWGMLIVGAATARGQSHHPLHEHFYQHWKQPNSNLPCCNARIEIDGIERGDCEPTEARLIAGHWYARLPRKGSYIEIPEAKIIRERNPTQDGTDAHLCWTEASGVMCFVPPFGGG